MRPEEFQKETNVSRETMVDLITYCETLLRWQKKINLVSGATIDDIWRRHFLDSFQVYDRWWKETGEKLLKKNRHQAICWIDFGSGAGFPGMVIAILMKHEPALKKNMQIHLVESVGKKAAFLSDVKRLTNTDVNIHTCRIESLNLPLGNGICKIFSARALASLDVLCEYIAPMFDGQSEAWFPKGDLVDKELERACHHWNFDVRQYPSLTNPEGSLLQIKHLEKK